MGGDSEHIKFKNVGKVFVLPERERKREQSQGQRQEEDRERLLMMLFIFKCSRRTAMDY